MRFKLSFGPAVLVTAAFIGPGTITLCILAGVNHGMSLLWAMLLSVIITIFIQNTAARIAWTTRKGLAKSVLNHTTHPFIKTALGILLVSAIFVGNAAYEAGNLTGALIGLKGILQMESLSLTGTFDWFPIVLGGGVASLFFFGSFKFLKNSLVVVVALMSVSFILTALMTKPALIDIFKGLFIPTFESDDILTIVGLLGTTVVPYNLFLHSAMVAQLPNTSLDQLRTDTFIAVGLGGIVSLCIIISAAALEGTSLANASDLGQSLVPLYGSAAPILMSFGFFAAGLTSALTAPMAAAFVVCECLNQQEQSFIYKTTALIVLIVGVVFNSVGFVPIEIIRFAQIANGILLPLIGLILIFMVNNKRLMRGATPNKLQNSVFVIIELFFIFLGIKSFGLIF